MAFVQRLDSALRVNLHFQLLWTNGVFAHELREDRVEFCEYGAIADADVAKLMRTIRDRVLRCLRRLGKLPAAGEEGSTATLGNLPYDLSPLGMPGCTLFVSADMVTMLVNWNGTAVWQMTIPNAPQLVGLPFYLQAGVLDRVNALGMVTTNAAEVRGGDH
ncbi:MAG: hypothetical protein IT456_20040 [Planctomycetes bacterium]|nr:hypothetical protein [Planctomycetota bacterium]